MNFMTFLLIDKVIHYFISSNQYSILYQLIFHFMTFNFIDQIYLYFYMFMIYHILCSNRLFHCLIFLLTYLNIELQINIIVIKCFNLDKNELEIQNQHFYSYSIHSYPFRQMNHLFALVINILIFITFNYYFQPF